MDKPFLSASAEIGRNFNLIQGAGGNTSYKDGNSLFVKASGCKLKDSLDKDIFVEVNLKKLRERLIDNIDNPLEGTWKQEKGKRPSMETNMHAVLPHKYIFHTHCLNTISCTVQKNFQKKLSEIFSNYEYAVIKYQMPGLPLAREIQKIIKKNNPDILFLVNHGLVICSNDINKALDLTYHVSDSLNSEITYKKVDNLKKLYSLCKDSCYRPTIYKEAHSIAFSDYKIKIVSSGSLYPDHVVFLGPRIFIAENSSDLRTIIKSTKISQKLPTIVVPNAGILVPENISSEAEELVLALSNIISKIPEDKKVNYLNLDAENELQISESEKYRFNLNFNN